VRESFDFDLICLFFFCIWQLYLFDFPSVVDVQSEDDELGY